MNNLAEKVIIPAWRLIKDDTRLKRLYFFPWLLAILLLSFSLSYQVIYTYVNVFNQKEKVLELLLEFLHASYFFEVVILSLVVALFYLFFMPVCEGALISYIDEKQSKDVVSFSDAMGVGLFRFLLVFEYNFSFSEFKLANLLNAYLFVIRFIWLEYIGYVNILFFILFIFSVIVNILFAYTKYEIVLWWNPVIKSIGISSKIAILNPKMTIKLFFLMFFLNVRVILNFIVFLVFPILFFAALVFISSSFFLVITLWMIALLFLFFIMVLGYLSWVLEIFKTSIWYFAYQEGKQKLETYDHHDEH